MKSKLHIIFLLSLLAISKIGYADNVQNIRYDNIVFKHIGIQQGLSHNTVNSIVQDNNGFMWFGTRNGLCRYDGYSIATYRHIKGDTTSINHNFTSQLYSDKRRGVIWVSNQQGVASYNIKRDCFTTYDTDVDIRNCVFLETIDGEILIGGNGGILKYDEELNAFKRYLSEASGYKMVNSIMQDESGLLWILSNQSLSCYNPTFDRTELLPSSLQSIKRRCRAMYS
ncbi:MAG: two-component regulator propeller domain-containing protein, partial [Rikenellaceae bacterium]